MWASAYRRPGEGAPPALTEAVALSAMRRPGELLLLGALSAIYALVHLLGDTILYPTMNVAGPVALAAILGWSCYRIVRQSPIAIWAPLFWFRLACAAYCGFGALVPHIVNHETRERIESLYAFDDALNLKVNLVYVFGIAACLGASYIFLKTRVRNIRRDELFAEYWTQHSTLFYALWFLVLGGILRYLFVIPYNFGLTENILPGAVGALSNMYYVGIYLLIVHCVGVRRSMLPVAWLLIGTEVLVSVASFSKTELLLVLIFSLLGFMSNEVTRAKIVVGVCCVSVAYFAFQPLVGFGRDVLESRYGEIRGASLGERWGIVQDYLREGHKTVLTDDQGGLSRLSYVNIGAMVVDRYDAGLSGDTLGNAFAVFIPRTLWPDKPVITQVGRDLYFLARGRDGSSLGVGHFAEAYWNFGWLGVAPVMALLALILSVCTRFSMRVMAARNWLFLPVVFLGVNMGLRVDGHFVPDVLGAAWMLVCLGLAVAVADRVMKNLLPQGQRLARRRLREPRRRI